MLTRIENKAQLLETETKIFKRNNHVTYMRSLTINCKFENDPNISELDNEIEQLKK